MARATAHVRSFWKFFHLVTDDRLYHSYDYTRWITVYLSLWFSCPRFSRVYHARWRVRHLLPKWRFYCQNAWLLTFHGVDYTYCQNGGQCVLIKNRGHNFDWVIHLVLSIICDLVNQFTRPARKNGHPVLSSRFLSRVFVITISSRLNCLLLNIFA